jgi:hypothetical protein
MSRPTGPHRRPSPAPPDRLPAPCSRCGRTIHPGDRFAWVTPPLRLAANGVDVIDDGPTLECALCCRAKPAPPPRDPWRPR